MAAAPNPRLRTVMAAFVRNLHAFAQEVGLTQDEYDLAISGFGRSLHSRLPDEQQRR
jgi:hypothetical protein